MPRAVYEHVLQRRLGDVYGFDLAGKRFHDFGGEAGAVLALEANAAIQYLGVSAESRLDPLRQRFGVARLEQDDVAADFAGEFGGRAQRDDFSVIEDDEP